MGEFRFSVYVKWQLGLLITFDRQIIIRVLFIDIHIAVSKYASGYYIFGKIIN